MYFLLNFISLLVFFYLYHAYDIFTATIALMVYATLIIVFKKNSFSKLHMIPLAMIYLFGGLTLAFNNSDFIQLKGTAVYWGLALFMLFNLKNGKNMIERLTGKELPLPGEVFNTLFLGWMTFFAVSGALNLYVALNYSTDAWVNFKVFGLTGMTLLFIVVQAVYLSKYISISDLDNLSDRRVD